MRHRLEPGSGVSIASLAYDYVPGWRVPEHAHKSDQLVYAIAGVMEISVSHARWLIPPQCAVWIPAGVVHSIRMPNAVAMRTLYLRARLAQARDCAVLHISPLLRELIVETVRLGDLEERHGDNAALSSLLVAQINKASTVPTMLAMPKDPRAQRVADLVLSNQRIVQKLELLCRKVGVSVRTMQRLFMQDIGMDFETWRRQARLVGAIEMLVSGRSVKQASFAMGYRQPSTFVAMFRKALGRTPKMWVSSLRSE